MTRDLGIGDIIMCRTVLGVTVVLSGLLGHVDAAEPEPTFTVNYRGISNKVRGLDTPKLAFNISNPGEARTVDYRVTVMNYFGQSVCDVLTGRLELKQGEDRQQSIDLPRIGDAQQYRLLLDLTDRDSTYTLRTRRRLLPDKASGFHRELFLGDLKWQHLAVDKLTDEPPADDGAWEDGPRWWRGRTFAEAGFSDSTQAVWGRCEIDAPHWLNGARAELYFTEILFLSRVYLNRQPLNNTTGGVRTPLWVDATTAFRPGERNVLHIRLQPMQAALKPTREGWPLGDGNGSSTWLYYAHFKPSFSIGDAWLRTYPTASIADVFVMPSVIDQQLRLRVELRNVSDDILKLALRHEVIDQNGETALRVERKQVTAGAGEIRTVEKASRWTKPNLWSPNNPYLYRLRTQLMEGDRVIDETSTRFGFRELRQVGRHLLFNGSRFKVRMSPATHGQGEPHEEAYRIFAHPGGQVGHVLNRDPEERPATMIRWHMSPVGEAVLDVADEVGALVELEFPVGSGMAATTPPLSEIWDNFANMVERFFRLKKNHPSMLTWSIDNELLIVTNTAPQAFEENQAGILRAAHLMQKLDPTRLVVSNGGGAIDGSWTNISLHYPHHWWLYPDLPDSAFWLQYGRRDIECTEPWPIQIDWDEPKVLHTGEDGLFIEAYHPHDMSSLGHDEVYRVTDREGPRADGPGTCHDFDARAFAMVIEGYRNVEISIQCGAMGGTGGPPTERAVQPVRSFVRERDSRFYSGETVQRHINLHHDFLEDAPVTFSWKLRRGEKMLDGAETTYAMTPAELRRVVVDLKMPQVAEPTPLTFSQTVTRRERQMWTETKQYTVYPSFQLELPPGLRLGVFDRARKTADFFRGQKVPFIYFSTIERGTHRDLADLNCLVVGEEGLDRARLPRLEPGLRDYLQRGGVVICLRQKWGHEWFSKNTRALPPDLLRRTTISFRRIPSHPVLRGITDDMLRYWRDDNTVSTGDFLKQPRPGWLPIVESGGPEGLLWTSIVEMPVGTGAVVFCQMHLLDKLKQEPTAQKILQNLLAYAVSREPVAPRRLGVLASWPSPVLKRLVQLGVDFTESIEADAVVIDAAMPADDSTIGALANNIRQGNTALLHGLTPENLARWRPILPAKVELTETKRIHAVRDIDHRILDGISGTDLWWGHYGLWGQSPRGAVEIRYSVRADGGTELVRDGGLVELTLGEGRILIDQLLWEKEDVHRERSGQYIALLLHNLAYGEF